MLTIYNPGIPVIGGLDASRTLTVDTSADLHTIGILVIGALAASRTLTVDTSADPLYPRDTSYWCFGCK